MANTPPIQFRLADDTLSQIDELVAALGCGNRAVAIRLAVARMHRQEISGISGPTAARKAVSPKAKGASGRKKKSA